MGKAIRNRVSQAMKMKRFLSFGLVSVMTMATAAPAFAASAAAEYHLEVYTNDQDTPDKRLWTSATEVLHTEGKDKLTGLTIKSGDEEKILDDVNKINDTTVKLPNGTTCRLSFKENANGKESLSILATNEIKDNVKIYLTTEESAYNIRGNSGRLDFGSNYGEDHAPTCSVTGSDVTVHGGESMNLVFTPNMGQQIKKLNIRCGYSNKTNLVNVANDTAVVEGIPFEIRMLEDGAVSVSCYSLTDDVFVTALTKQASSIYDLNVKTDTHISSNVADAHIASDEVSQVVFTPDPGYSIYKFIIQDGNDRRTLYATDSSVSMGGKVYKITKNLNGQIMMDIPEANNDVKIEAVSSYGNYYIDVVDRSHVSANYDEMTWVGYGEDVTVILTPDSGYDVTYVTISMGDTSIRVSTSENDFNINGKNYRMEKSANGTVYLYFRDLDANVQIDPSTEDNSLVLTVKTDGGVDCSDEGRIELADGDMYQLNFIPRTSHRIQNLKITRNGKTYTVLPNDNYVMINGTHCPVNWTYDGRVVITLYDITSDMTVAANSDYVSGNRTITKRPDSHSTISHDARNSGYAKPDESVTFDISPKQGYLLSTVKLSTKTDSVTLYGNTSRFMLNNRSYYVDHLRDGTWRVTFPTLPDNLIVESKTVKTGYDLPDGPIADDSYHHAYMTGVGYGYFEPNRNMTRAEAVVMLSRLFYNTGDLDISIYDPNFYDAPNSAWYNDYLGWAQANGLLDANGYFRPDEFITRAEFIDLLCRFKNVDVSGYNGYALPFTDLKDYNWLQVNYKTAAQISYASSHGWIYGYPDGTFGPNNLIRRSEVVAMTNRAVGRRPDKEYIYMNQQSLNRFVDVPYGDWAYYDIMEATNSHYVKNITGNGETWSRYSK